MVWYGTWQSMQCTEDFDSILHLPSLKLHIDFCIKFSKKI